MTDPRITPLDYGILIGYFIIVLMIGYVFARRTNTGQDYFLAGNRLRWTAIGFSLFASNISSSSIIGLTGQAHASGISIANYEWMATLILVFMAIFIIPVYLRNKIVTIPQYLELRYNAFTRKYYSLVTILLTIVVDIASSLFGGALVIHVFVPEIPVLYACYFMALISGLYTAAGGLAAVVYTDLLQAIILIISSAIMLFAVLGQFDFSWAEAISQVDPRKLSIMQPLNDPNLPWLGTLLGVPILGFYYWVTNQYVVQRILGAKNIQHAQGGAFLAATLKLLVLFLIVFPGIFSSQLFPGFAHSDEVYPAMLIHLIPDGVKGIVLAGLIAAIMSSVDSALNGTSSLIVLDFIQPRRPDLSEKQLIRYGQITTLLVMAIAGLWAPSIQNFTGLFNYLQQVLTYLVPPVVSIFVMAFFWRRGTARAAQYTLIFGHILCFLTLLLVNKGWFNLHFSIIAALLTVICLIGFCIISIRDQSPGSDIAMYMWNSKSNPADVFTPWYLRPYFIGGMLILATLVIVYIYF